MIIDFHTHCFADEIAVKAIPKLARAGGIKPFTDGTVEGLKKSMQAAGIDISVVQPIATKPQQTVTINRWAAEIRGDSIISFGTIHPEYSNWKEEILWLSREGFKGVKFHPDYQDFFVDDKKLFNIYEMLFSMNFIVLFHAGLDIAFPEPYHCTPERLQKLPDTFPGAVIVAAHMGGYLYWKGVENYLIGRDIYLDTSFSFDKLGKEDMERMIRKHGTERVLFATDSPWKEQQQELKNIQSLSLNEDEINAILGGNAQKILRLNNSETVVE